MSTVVHKWVEQARAGTNRRVVCRVHSGWVVMGESQFLRGYSLVLPDPVVATVNDLSREGRERFLYEMSAVGDALLAATDARRINYEILGNLEPALHGHVFPRYEQERADLRTQPVWFHDWEAGPAFDVERDGDLMRQIHEHLKAAGVAVDA